MSYYINHRKWRVDLLEDVFAPVNCSLIENSTPEEPSEEVMTKEEQRRIIWEYLS